MLEDSEYYKKLLKLVSTGFLEILYIISPPRALSTVLEIALSEYGHGQIHEPFHKRRRKDFDDGCRIVYSRVIYLQKKFDTNRVKIVIKDLSKFVKPGEWNLLVNLANRFIFTIREPSKQIFSMASRYANDLDDYDVDKLDYQQILANLPRIPFEDLAQGYWENLLELLKITEKYINASDSKSKSKCVAIVSGITFRSDPSDSISKLLKRLRLNVDSNKILKKWTVAREENFYRPDYIVNNTERDKEFRNGAWLSHALNSNTFDKLDPKHDAPQDIDIYDRRLQNYFLSNILPAYIKIYLDKNNICRPNPEVVLSESYINSEIVLANPIEAYVLCKSFHAQNTQQAENQQRSLFQLETLIKKKYPYIAKQLFNLI